MVSTSASASIRDPAGQEAAVALALGPPPVSPIPRAAPNCFLASVGEHAAQIKHMNRRAGTFLLFTESLYGSFSFWKQVGVLHHRGLRTTAASLGGFASPSSVPSAMSLQVLLEKTFPCCHLLSSDSQRTSIVAIVSRSCLSQRRPPAFL